MARFDTTLRDVGAPFVDDDAYRQGEVSKNGRRGEGLRKGRSAPKAMLRARSYSYWEYCRMGKANWPEKPLCTSRRSLRLRQKSLRTEKATPVPCEALVAEQPKELVSAVNAT